MSPRVCLAALLGLLLAGLPAKADDASWARGEASALQAARRHGVLVAFTFQRDAAREAMGATPPNARGLAERYRFWRLSWIVPGIVAGDRRTVLISDVWISPTSVEKIEIVEQDGRRTAARLHGVLPTVEGAVVKTETDLGTEPVVFSTQDGATLPGMLFAASVAEGADGPEVWAERLGSVTRAPWSAGEGVGFGRPTTTFEGVAGSADEGERHVDLVVDAQGTPWGFRFGESLDASGHWRGSSVLNQPILPYETLAALADRAATDGAIHRVSVAYRTASRHDRSRSPFSTGSRGTAEQDFWGLAVAPDLLLVPADLADPQVRRIVSIHLPDDAKGSGAAATATYAGRVRGYRAFLVRVEGMELTPVEATVAPPARGALLLVHRVARRGGARRDSVDPNRVVGRSRGFGDQRFLASERPIKAGAFLRDATGSLVGFTAVLDPANRDYQVGGGSTRAGARSPFFPVAVLPAELGGLAVLVASPDTDVMPQEEVESHRRAWLGVEGHDLDEGVADLLGISQPTRDGRRGLMVSRVYGGSPAAVAGVVDGDVLLSVRRVSAPGGPETDLRGGGGRTFMPSFFPGRGAPAPWRSRDNAITRLLDAWRADTEYELLWLHARKEKRATIRVEMAPPDFSSAPREFDEATGLEVRDLTYEVRAALRMAPDAPGVVVGRVEQGTSAAQARLEPNEILLEVDGVPIRSAAAFRKRLAEAREQGTKTLRLAVRRLGRTRLVDIQPGSSETNHEEQK